LIRHRSHPIVESERGRWWKLLSAGVVLLGALVVVTTITGELPQGGWYVAMATMLTSFALIGTGVVLGIASRFRSVNGV
jgi:drug/metabolite transporter (DMT)-like permease